jgi:hypothetical protein
MASSFIVHLTTLYLGLIYASASHYNYLPANQVGKHWFLLSLLVAPNVYLYSLWLHEFRKELLRQLAVRMTQSSSIGVAYMILACRKYNK